MTQPITLSEQYPELVHLLQIGTPSVRREALRALEEIDRLRTEVARLREHIPAPQGTSLSHWPDGGQRR